MISRATAQSMSNRARSQCMFCGGPMSRTRAGFDEHQVSQFHQFVLRAWEQRHAVRRQNTDLNRRPCEACD